VSFPVFLKTELDLFPLAAMSPPALYLSGDRFRKAFLPFLPGNLLFLFYRRLILLFLDQKNRDAALQRFSVLPQLL